MPKWTEYTSKDTLADNDEVMLYDATGKANKRGLMSKFWDYVVDKMATAVISKLQTDNKTIIGAINALNGNQAISITNVNTSILISGIALVKAGNIVVISYSGDTTDSVKRGDLQVIGTIPSGYVPKQRVVIAPIQSTPQRIQLTFEKNGNITAYNYGNEITTRTSCRYNGCYVC